MSVDGSSLTGVTPEFFDPNSLDEGVFLEQFRERQQKYLDHIITSTEVTNDTAFVFAEAGLDISFDEVIQPLLDTLLENANPDFILSKWFPSIEKLN